MYGTTLITLLRIPYLCHFGSTSFVLPIRPKNRVMRVRVYFIKPQGSANQEGFYSNAIIVDSCTFLRSSYYKLMSTFCLLRAMVKIRIFWPQLPYSRKRKCGVIHLISCNTPQRFSCTNYLYWSSTCIVVKHQCGMWYSGYVYVVAQ